MTRTLSHRDILRNGARIALARAALHTRRPKALHDHDFFELFWVQNGKVRHHLRDGSETLAEGDMVFLRPDQEHALQGVGEAALVVLIAIHPAVVEALAERHPQLSGQLFWGTSAPVTRHRDIRQLAQLNHTAVQLEHSARDTLAAEAFLLPLCAGLLQAEPTAEIPDWLAAACRAAEDPAIFREGAAGLAAVTGKAHAHVSRMMRRHLGQTPSDYINAIRMRHAARALVTDQESVSDIATDCGIPNLSHFHKLFRESFGMTPLQYRQQLQRGLIQPE